MFPVVWLQSVWWYERTIEIFTVPLCEPRPEGVWPGRRRRRRWLTLTPSAYSCRLAPIFLYTCKIEISSLGQSTSQWTCFFRCRRKRKVPIGLFLSCYCTLFVYVSVRWRSSWFVPFDSNRIHVPGVSCLIKQDGRVALVGRRRRWGKWLPHELLWLLLSLSVLRHGRTLYYGMMGYMQINSLYCHEPCKGNPMDARFRRSSCHVTAILWTIVTYKIHIVDVQCIWNCILNLSLIHISEPTRPY